MQTILLVLASFILPFAIFLLLPLWKNKRGDGTFILMMIAVYLWGAALFSTFIYASVKYLFKQQDFSFYQSYLLALCLGILTLVFWLIVKRIFKVK